MSGSFHNTNIADGELLKAAEVKARSQEDEVYTFFRKNWRYAYSPSQVWKKLIDAGKIKATVPLTSIRRAMSNLVYRKRLRKTTYQVKGVYGMPEHKWKLRVRLKKQKTYVQGKLSLK
jgi:hypothetical protein